MHQCSVQLIGGGGTPPKTNGIFVWNFFAFRHHECETVPCTKEGTDGCSVQLIGVRGGEEA